MRARCPIQDPSTASSTNCRTSILEIRRHKFREDSEVQLRMTVVKGVLCSPDDVLHAPCLGVPAELGEVQHMIHRLDQRRAACLHCL